DIMLDRYTWGDAERVSPEAPVIVLRADQEEIRPGGAASVAYLLRHLDADVSLAGVIGSDADGNALRAMLRDEGIDDRFVLMDSTRPTTAKHRFVGRASDRHPHQILRVDHESRFRLDDSMEERLWSLLEHELGDFDAILVADYIKGVCTESLLQQVITIARQNGQPVLIDPGRVTDYTRYRGATLLKPNRVEAELVTGRALPLCGSAIEAARSLCQKYAISNAIITLDRDGLIVATPESHVEIPTHPRAVYDITGAGDMVLAMLGLCLAGGLTVFDAARLANIAAGLEVERFGIAPVQRAEIVQTNLPATCKSAAKLVTTTEISDLASTYRQQGKRIVFTNGCFDLLHVGHVTCLEEAALMGDVLIVAVNSDASVKRLKGPSRPVISQQERATILASLGGVDHVVIFDDDTPVQLLSQIRPHLLVKGGTTQEIIGRDIVESYGGEVRQVGTVEGKSTTQLIATIKP
ncbi:MAG TPA: D-glycero-beta-D-manno-heptose 1-phosphate adenylyltransferase, partial [Schlesneria sp.]